MIVAEKGDILRSKVDHIQDEEKEDRLVIVETRLHLVLAIVDERELLMLEETCLTVGMAVVEDHLAETVVQEEMTDQQPKIFLRILSQLLNQKEEAIEEESKISIIVSYNLALNRCRIFL